MGEIAAAAQAARRGRCIDTVVLAKCRRKSQTMWPARLCSRREVRGWGGGRVLFSWVWAGERKGRDRGGVPCVC